MKIFIILLVFLLSLPLVYAAKGDAFNKAPGRGDGFGGATKGGIRLRTWCRDQSQEYIVDYNKKKRDKCLRRKNVE